MDIILQMTSAISVEDVRREVKILKALSGHKNMIKFHDAFEDANNVYIVMEYVCTCYSLFLRSLILSSSPSSIFKFNLFTSSTD